MILRPARESDFPHLETFVWQAIFPAFDQPELTAAQRAENDAMVEGGRAEVMQALEERDTAVFVAIEPKRKRLAGYLIIDGAPAAYTRLRCIIVKRAYWGKGVATLLMAEATNFVGHDRAVSVAVRHYNARAMAFLAKHDFVDTGETSGDHAIPRTLLLREAYEELTLGSTSATNDGKADGLSLWEEDFPSDADEPVFEALPDYKLSVDETPQFQTGQNALSISEEIEEDGKTSLSETQLTELEAFIARARAKKGTAAPSDAAILVEVSKPGVAAPRPAASKVTKTKRPVADLQDKQASVASTKKQPAFDRSKIEFEVDYGERSVPAPKTKPAEEPTGDAGKATAKSSFEFAFDADSASEETPVPQVVNTTPSGDAVVEARKETSLTQASTPATPLGRTKQCPDCERELPAMARFCFSCGHPQPEEPEESGRKAPMEEFLILEDLTDAPEEKDSRLDEPFTTPAKTTVSEKPVTAAKEPVEGARRKESSPGGTSSSASPGNGHQQREKSATPNNRQWSFSELKIAFREHLQAQLLAYFDERKLKIYIARLEESSEFQGLRDGSLKGMLNWLNHGVHTEKAARSRIKDTLADLSEYFIVETAGNLSEGILPQRLLRHQSLDWETADLFKVVMDYLDFDAENELVYTDFVTMPSRALRNATKSFIRAKKDERVFLICDQSLLSQAKNGFAITDSGLYWKNVLQPAGAVTFTTLQQVKLEQGHLSIDGQFFNAGSRLNLKMGLLLDRLRRM
jgi:GNAT superfamily N-acetyltransferase